MNDQFSTYKNALQKAGLNQNETDLYLYLLEQGKSSIQQLLKDTGIKRGNLYHILYSLRDQGLIEQLNETGKLHFQLKDPYFLRDLITKQRTNVEATAREIESIIPSLLSTFTLTTERPSVRSYEGAPGLVSVYEELNAAHPTELLLIRSIYDSADAEVEKIINKQIKQQVKLGIQTKALTPLTEASHSTFRELDRKHLVERHLVERKLFSLDAQFLIWNDTVAIISMRKQLIATVIENVAIAQSMRTLFHYIWQASEPFHHQTIARWDDSASLPSTR